MASNLSLISETQDPKSLKYNTHFDYYKGARFILSNWIIFLLHLYFKTINHFQSFIWSHHLTIVIIFHITTSHLSEIILDTPLIILTLGQYKVQSIKTTFAESSLHQVLARTPIVWFNQYIFVPHLEKPCLAMCRTVSPRAPFSHDTSLIVVFMYVFLCIFSIVTSAWARDLTVSPPYQTGWARFTTIVWKYLKKFVAITIKSSH